MNDSQLRHAVAADLRQDIKARKAAWSSLERQLEERDAGLLYELQHNAALGATVSVPCGCAIRVTGGTWSHWDRCYSYSGELLQCAAHQTITEEIDGH